MSLDVYLTRTSAAESDDERTGVRIYVRRDGRTVEVTRDEWFELHPNHEPVAVMLPEGEGEVYWRNITHNLGKMAQEAGLYEAMWRPDEQGWTHARDLIEPLRDGLATLQSDPERFREFNPPNGWGSYEGLLDFVASYLAACIQWPDAEVRVSR